MSVSKIKINFYSYFLTVLLVFPISPLLALFSGFILFFIKDNSNKTEFIFVILLSSIIGCFNIFKIAESDLIKYYDSYRIANETNLYDFLLLQLI